MKLIIRLLKEIRIVFHIYITGLILLAVSVLVRVSSDLSYKVTGLSKLARLVDLYAKQPQVQERLTSQVADALVDKLGAHSVIVVIECEHLCMAMRGIRKPGASTTTSAVRGGFKRDSASRAEVLSLIRGR